MRKFAKTLAVVGVITPAGVNAIGVGEIKLHSALNQKLLAEIPILVSSGEDISQIRVNLAPAEAFAKAGLPRPYYLSNLRFKPIHKADGSIVIQVTSSDVIREPFMDFLLEVDWPQGRMLREFTVLLDPPVMFADAVKVVQEPPVILAPVEHSHSEAVDVAEAGRAVEYGPVRRGESLWAIAEHLKPDGITTEQMAMALFKANPHAFLDANINTLRARVMLKMPTREALIELSPSQARREFQQQYKTWLARQAPEPESQLAPAAAGQELTDAQPAQAQLKLELPREAESASGQPELPMVEGQAHGDPEIQATVESLRRENETLRARLDALERQVTALIELRQTELAAMQAAGDASADQSTPPEAGTEVETGTAPTEETAPVGRTAPEVDAEPTAESKPEPAPMPLESAEKPEPKPAPTPKAAPKPAPEGSSLLSEVLDAPLYLSLGGGSLILLGIAGWLIWHRRRAAAEQADSLLVEMDLHAGQQTNEDALGAAPAEAVAPVGVGGVGIAESSFLSEFTPSDFDILEGESDAVDPLAEADVYLAYGRYNQAEELIRQALAEDPKRPELRLKLLEIFYAKEDPMAFEAYAQELKALGADRDRGFWEKVAEMGRELCFQSQLFAGDEMPAGLGTAGRRAWSEEDVNPDFGSESTAEAVSVSEEHPSEDANSLDFDLGDFDLEAVKQDADSPKLAAFEENDAGFAFAFHLENPDGDVSGSGIQITASDFQEDATDTDEDFDLTDMDELDTKLDLARAYVDMEDIDAAKEILEEVFSCGNETQKQAAKTLLDKLGLTS